MSTTAIADRQPPPKGLLLDFGSVMTVSVFERHRATETALGLRPGQMNWLGPLAPETDDLWRSMQQDRISERDYWAQRARETGELVGERGWDMHAMLTRIRHVDPNQALRPQMRRLVLDAHAQGIRVGILSNELELFNGPRFAERLDIIHAIDAVVDGTHTHILKPDPRAYEQAVAAMRLEPGQILFVDDQFRNIAGGVKAGLQTQFFDLRDIAGNLAAIRARLRLAPDGADGKEAA